MRRQNKGRSLRDKPGGGWRRPPAIGDLQGFQVSLRQLATGGVDGEALMTALQTGLTDFEAALYSSADTHPFTRPDGNGRAFDRFVEIYEALSSRDRLPDSDEQETPSIDQTT